MKKKERERKLEDSPLVKFINFYFLFKPLTLQSLMKFIVHIKFIINLIYTRTMNLGVF